MLTQKQKLPEKADQIEYLNGRIQLCQLKIDDQLVTYYHGKAEDVYLADTSISIEECDKLIAKLKHRLGYQEGSKLI